MSDLEALKYAPTSFVLSGLFSVGVTLLFGASWRFCLGLTIILGMTVWFLTVSHEDSERRCAGNVHETHS